MGYSCKDMGKHAMHGRWLPESQVPNITPFIPPIPSGVPEPEDKSPSSSKDSKRTSPMLVRLGRKQIRFAKMFSCNEYGSISVAFDEEGGRAFDE